MGLTRWLGRGAWHLIVNAGLGFVGTLVADPHAQGAERLRDVAVATLPLATLDLLGLLARRRGWQRSLPSEPDRPTRGAADSQTSYEHVTHVMRQGL